MKRSALLVLTPVLLVANFVSVGIYLWKIYANPDKALYISIGIDRVANAAFNGNVTETISSRANRAKLANRRWGCVLCKFLDWLSKDHCKNSAGI